MCQALNQSSCCLCGVNLPKSIPCAAIGQRSSRRGTSSSATRRTRGQGAEKRMVFWPSSQTTDGECSARLELQFPPSLLSPADGHEKRSTGTQVTAESSAQPQRDPASDGGWSAEGRRRAAHTRRSRRPPEISRDCGSLPGGRRRLRPTSTPDHSLGSGGKPQVFASVEPGKFEDPMSPSNTQLKEMSGQHLN